VSPTACETKLIAVAGGEKLQNQWRAMTVRMLSAEKDKSAASTAESAHKSVQDSKEAAYALFSEQVVTSSKALLRHVDTQDATTRSDELTALFASAGELACKLHRQNVKIGVILSPQELNPFSIDSDTMEPHTKINIEQDDHSWDGRPIDVVVTPAILAYGDERGENYSMFKVWSKAVVWMEERKDIKTPGKGVIPDKGKSSARLGIKKTKPMEPVIVSDDDDGDESDDDYAQSTTSPAKEVDEDFQDSGGKTHILQKSDQTEQRPRRATRSVQNVGYHGSPQALQNGSSKDETKHSFEVSIGLPVESSQSMKSNDHRADQTDL
jgi:hypothetical protein